MTHRLAEYSGRLYIDWGGGSSGKRSWNQRADVQSKRISELHLNASEESFPGFMAIALPLSAIAEAPVGWIQRLAEARGVYLLACPRNGELYVGSATAVGGFWTRWQEYLRNGHGGNIALVDREPTDWRVAEHRQEIVEFAERIAGGTPKFEALSYLELWDAWASSDDARLVAHVGALRARYEVPAWAWEGVEWKDGRLVSASWLDELLDNPEAERAVAEGTIKRVMADGMSEDLARRLYGVY